MKLKHLGWQSFSALLLSDLVGIVMLKLGIGLRTTLTVGALVFVILLVVLALGLHTKLTGRKREEAAVAKIAELQDQMATEAAKKDESAK